MDCPTVDLHSCFREWVDSLARERQQSGRRCCAKQKNFQGQQSYFHDFGPQILWDLAQLSRAAGL